MRYLIAVLVTILLALSFNANAEDQWVLKKDSDGVKAYLLSDSGSDLITYKGEVEINAPLEVILEVLKDTPSYTQWYYNLKESKLIKANKSRSENVMYMVIHLGWPTSDRDFIIFATQLGDPKNGEVTFAMDCITDEIIPKKEGLVRVKRLNGGMYLKKVDKNRTAVTLVMKSETGGSIPVALARLFATDAPFNTMKGLRKIAAMDKYYELAGISKNK
jgi:hypothetical protein